MAAAESVVGEIAGADGGANIVNSGDLILVTGANGFIGSRVVRTLLDYGFDKIRCFVRPTGGSSAIDAIAGEHGSSRIQLVKGNLLSREDCRIAAAGVSVVYHLAAGTDKTFPGCVLNSVVTTRNLLDAVVATGVLKRFVNISSLSVYSNARIKRGGVLDESCPVDDEIVERHDPYAYAKAKQDELVLAYANSNGLPYVIVRPGVTFGPGKANIPGRVGNNSFGVFLHLGLGNQMPLTYVDNCAEAIVLAGLRRDINGEVFNIVDGNLPTSRQFLAAYKGRVRRFASIPVPYPVFYALSWVWERYSKWSEGQLPPVFNRRACAIYYKGNVYANAKARERMGWQPKVGMADALDAYFKYARMRLSAP